MPDSPDYSKFLPNSSRFSLQDMGELAVRLGAISKYDRRGEIIYQNDFRYGLSYVNVSGEGTGNSQTIVPGNYNDSGFSLQLIPGTNGNKRSDVNAIIAGQPVTRFGFEMGFSLPDSYDYFILSGFATSQDTLYQFGVKFDLNDGTVSILKSDNTYEVIYNDIALGSDTQSFVVCKVVIDIDLEKYVRMNLMTRQKSLTTYDLKQSSIAYNPYTRIDGSIIGDGISNKKCYISHIILTGNEP